jgi:starvation-inducible DNA-binding protein
MKTGLTDQVRQSMVQNLRVLLANEYMLYTKTLKFHWNVEGANFGPLHALFKEHYERIFIIVDDVAERIRALGHMSPGTLREFLDTTTLTEAVGVNPNDLGMIRLLLEDHEAIIRDLRVSVDLSAQLNDMGSNNFLAGLLEVHEKMAWMLRAHVSGS